jgi:hypothetical protein
MPKPIVMNFYGKVPGLGQERNDGLTYLILAAILKTVSLGTHTTDPWNNMEGISLNAVEYRLRFPLDVRHCFKMPSIQFHFQFGRQSEITGGLSPASRADGER